MRSTEKGAKHAVSKAQNNPASLVMVRVRKLPRALHMNRKDQFRSEVRFIHWAHAAYVAFAKKNVPLS